LGSKEGREQRGGFLGLNPIIALANKPFEQKQRPAQKCPEAEK